MSVVDKARLCVSDRYMTNSIVTYAGLGLKTFFLYAVNFIE